MTFNFMPIRERLRHVAGICLSFGLLSNVLAASDKSNVTPSTVSVHYSPSSPPQTEGETGIDATSSNAESNASVTTDDGLPNEAWVGQQAEENNAIMPAGGFPADPFARDDALVGRMRGTWKGMGTSWSTHGAINDYYEEQSYQWTLTLTIGGFSNPRSPYPASRNFQGVGTVTYSAPTQRLEPNPSGMAVPNIVLTNPGPFPFNVTGFYSDRTKNLVFTSMSPANFVPYTDHTLNANKPMNGWMLTSIPLSSIGDNTWVVKSQSTRATITASTNLSQSGDDIQGQFVRTSEALRTDTATPSGTQKSTPNSVPWPWKFLAPLLAALMLAGSSLKFEWDTGDVLPITGSIAGSFESLKQAGNTGLGELGKSLGMVAGLGAAFYDGTQIYQQSAAAGDSNLETRVKLSFSVGLDLAGFYAGGAIMDLTLPAVGAAVLTGQIPEAAMIAAGGGVAAVAVGKALGVAKQFGINAISNWFAATK